MSRVGKNPVTVPSDVRVVLSEAAIEVSGKNGKLSLVLSDSVKVVYEDERIAVTPSNETKHARAMWGTTQRRIQGMIQGVHAGVNVTLDLVGVGYRAAVEGNKITLQLGLSHEVVYHLPEGVSARCDKPTVLVLSGADRQILGQVASELRAHRKPEPYKGKGVIRQGEFVVRKEIKKK